MDTACVIAGGGPAGAMLGLLLARSGVDVTLLEKHADFLRDFRGDTIHPSTLHVLDELGLAEEFHRLPHHKMYSLTFQADRGSSLVADLRGLPGKYNYIAFIPQWDFLTLVITEARRYPNFRLIMEAEATDVIHEDGVVRGVRYRDPSGTEHRIGARLTVGADGRSSDVRRAVGLAPRDLGAPMDVVWFRLPMEEGDPKDMFLRASTGGFMVCINRDTYWQLAYVIAKGGFGRLKAAGIEGFRESVARLLPYFAGRLEGIRSFDDVSVLVVALNRLRRWHLPGLLFLGDAAHAMSPVFGVGINLAIQDAVAAANLLAEPLRSGAEIPDSMLARVQQRREFPTKVTQFAQRIVQNRVIRPTLEAMAAPPPIPEFVNALPFTRSVARRFVGLGVRPEHVRIAPAAPPGGLG
ncbi:2-polyprenyl-6-methoxyphenol hydroxylase [Sinosporangium album]|uniref:2-polyprenyl-6-methoxyphenol hydroxylase n=1 Tax=Sinosporangium album TaxID=504805 RepID=A0A1G8DXU2_9ACTN|nr:FAD-dependent oxidoreductase [Sinosporangium album]SDH62497.1 2-polyprenyl-6-methoxyphenol hydroxylase [Sinosporangium album]